MEQNLHLYRSLGKLLILKFWEIIRTGNYFLLDVDFVDGKVYTKGQKDEIDLIWSQLYDEYYNLKKDGKIVKIVEDSNDAVFLLNKINLLNENLHLLQQLYDNQLILDEDKFIQIEQGIYKTFVTIDKKITPKYFSGFEANAKIVNRFINSYQATYDIDFKRLNQAVDKEVKNVYKTVAITSTILGYRLDVEKMSVLEYLAYEEQAIEKQTAEKELKDGK